LEPCINGQVAAVGAYFHQDVRPLIDRLVTEQLADGGWNCDAPHRSARSSFNTTICVLEALLEYELHFGSCPQISAARIRAQEYLLRRRLFRRQSTGEIISACRKSGANFTSFAFPTWWHYDVLRGLEYLRRASVTADNRLTDAINLVESKQDARGRWLLDTEYPGVMLVRTNERQGEPSRWNTMRALRVLRWYSAGK
jgi:hypothetical protein